MQWIYCHYSRDTTHPNLINIATTQHQYDHNVTLCLLNKRSRNNTILTLILAALYLGNAFLCKHKCYV